MDPYRVRLTPAEAEALSAVLRLGESAEEFVTSAINAEIGRRERGPKQGFKAVGVMRLQRAEASAVAVPLDMVVGAQHEDDRTS